jgi:low temperature requirement protein LtrA
MSSESRSRLFRQRDREGSDSVTNIELFFDLVFVFAITQLSHRLLDHLTLLGAVETLVLFGAIWWLWVYTSWATNWLDPERGAVRTLLIAMMLGGLVMSVTLPDAFAKGGLVFATAYVTMQVVRTLVIVFASRGVHHARALNFLRITFYFILSAPLWIAGAFAEADTRLAFWAVAVAIEYAGPWLFFRTPFLGRSNSGDWDISGAHMAERCALFIIIALGEAILVTGATFAKLESTTPTIIAFATSFVGSAAMWWIYFDTGAKRAGEAIEHTEDTGRLARNAYTYLHMPIVAGIIVTAVGDEMMLAHPLDHASLRFIFVACGGPLLFLAGNQAFKWVTADRRFPPLSHFVGQTVLIGIGFAGWWLHWAPLMIGMGAALALVFTAVWEWFALNGGWQRWIPWHPATRKIAPDDTAG